MSWSIEPKGMDVTQAPSKSISTENRATRAVANWLAKADNRATEYVREMTNADVSGHTPENLQIIDDLLDEDLREYVRRRGELDSTMMIFGSYLGEVFIRNLACRWRYPSWSQSIRGLMSRDRFRAEQYSYIVLHEQKVYVFRAAHEAIEKTGMVYSLYEFYQRWAKGTRAP